MKNFDPLEPFKNKKLLRETMDALTNFEYKLFGKIKKKLYRGKPTVYEFDLDLGIIHFTEQDFRGISKIFSDLNKKWKTDMMYCIYPSKDNNRHIILNVRGSPKAPSEID